jgi:hypothetical protein
MPLHGPWTDSTGTGFTYPNAYLVAHERIDTVKQTVVMDVTIWASSATVQSHPIYTKSHVPTAPEITTIVNFIESHGDTSLLNKAPFSGMSTTA